MTQEEFVAVVPLPTDGMQQPVSPHVGIEISVDMQDPRFPALVQCLPEGQSAVRAQNPVQEVEPRPPRARRCQIEPGANPEVRVVRPIFVVEWMLEIHFDRATESCCRPTDRVVPRIPRLHTRLDSVVVPQGCEHDDLEPDVLTGNVKELSGLGWRKRSARSCGDQSVDEAGTSE